MSPQPTQEIIDFSKTPLASNYTGLYASVLDDVFTEAECRSLIALATSPLSANQGSLGSPSTLSEPPSTDASVTSPWRPAGLSAEASHQTVHADFRNSERIIRIDAHTAGWIYDRVRPFLESELGAIKQGSKWDAVVGRKGKVDGTWKLAGPWPRLSFLRYTSGHFFKQHCDGLLTDPAAENTYSRVTLHIYLNSDCEGGATRFWSPDKKRYLDVEPRIGRVLMFQQRMLVHSGEEVRDGVKYTLRLDVMFRQEMP